MGGNALSVESVRLKRDDYFVVATQCVRTLRGLLPGNRIADIVAYSTKESFGDLDVLIESTGYDPHTAAQALGATEVVRNGDVTSIGILVCKHIPTFDPKAVFQVDLIKSSPAAFGYSQGYFGYIH